MCVFSGEDVLTFKIIHFKKKGNKKMSFDQGHPNFCILLYLVSEFGFFSNFSYKANIQTSFRLQDGVCRPVFSYANMLLSVFIVSTISNCVRNHISRSFRDYFNS